MRKTKKENIYTRKTKKESMIYMRKRDNERGMRERERQGNSIKDAERYYYIHDEERDMERGIC